MKVAPAILTLALASLSGAQLGSLPTCAQSCANEFFAGDGGYAGCGTDPKCICSNASFIGQISCCLEGSCDAADQQAAILYAQAICKDAGVSVGTVISCTSTASGAGSTASGSVSATTTPYSQVVSTTSSSASTSSATTAASSESASSVSTTLSPGAKAGIGISVALVFVVGMGIVLCLCRRRRQSPDSKPAAFRAELSSDGALHELGPGEAKYPTAPRMHYVKWTTGGRGLVHELDAASWGGYHPTPIELRRMQPVSREYKMADDSPTIKEF